MSLASCMCCRRERQERHRPICNAQWTRSKLDNHFWYYIALSVLDGFTIHHLINRNKTCRRQNILRSLHHGIR